MCHTLASDSAGDEMSGKRKENHCKHERTGLRMNSTDSVQGNKASSRFTTPRLLLRRNRPLR